MVEEDREYFSATFEVSDASDADDSTTASAAERSADQDTWQAINYAPPEAIIWHGPELQELRRIRDGGATIDGRIAASAAVQLFGGNRATGFTVACSTFDACLYAIGWTAWHRHQKPSLPVKFDRIEFGRLPDPGELCTVRVTPLKVSDVGAGWNFSLDGLNGDRLMTVTGYRTAWLTIGNRESGGAATVATRAQQETVTATVTKTPGADASGSAGER